MGVIQEYHMGVMGVIRNYTQCTLVRNNCIIMYMFWERGYNLSDGHRVD